MTITLKNLMAAFEHVVSAYVVAPDPKVTYHVAHAGDHPTLKTGDRVLMTETPKHQNLLLRTDDYSLHGLMNKDEAYVILIPSEWVDHDPPKP